MNRPDAPPKATTLIDLAQEADFSLGELHVSPSLRRVATKIWQEMLEPRVMQVLIVLTQADGAVVSRDTLIERCWSGRIVGDDAINRCIVKIRHLAQRTGGFGFEIGTVPRVGYRLSVTQAASDGRNAISSLDLRSTTVAREFRPSLNPPPEPVLAVLAFDNLSGDPDLTWFSDGVSDEIQQTVARGAHLKVIGRTSSLQYRGDAKKVSQVAAELKATHILDGSVRRSGSRVRISVQLIDCVDQTTLWSDGFDRELTDMLLLQDEIAGAVASALKAKFSGASSGLVDPVAYNLFLQTTSFSGRDHVHIGEAIRLLERAVALAPDFAPAWAALALRRMMVYRRATLDEVNFSVSRDEAAFATETALRLDPKSGMAHMALANFLPWGDYDGREALLAKAVASAPNDSTVTVEMGWFLMSVGRNEEALDCARQALALDPFNRWAANLCAQALAAVGRYEEAQVCLDQARVRQPLSRPHTAVALFLAAINEDWDTFGRLRGYVKDTALSGAAVREALGFGKMLRDPGPNREKMLAIVDGMLSRTGTVEIHLLAIASRFGLIEEVFARLERISFEHLSDPDGPPPSGVFSPGSIFLPALSRSMIADVRFVSFCAKLGLCDYWIRNDRWPDCSGFVPYKFKLQARRLVTIR